MNNKKKNKGFTLVELVVILVILAILMAILVPSLTGYIAKARKTACDVNMNYTYKALKAEYVVQYAKGTDGLTQEALTKVMTEDMEGTISGDGYADICPYGGIYTVTADKFNITVTCSKHGEGSGNSASNNTDNIMNSQTMYEYFFGPDGAGTSRTALDSTGPNFGGDAKKEIAASLGLNPDTFDFRIYRDSSSSMEYKLYLSPKLDMADVGKKVSVTGYKYTYNPDTKKWTRASTGTSQEIAVQTGTQHSTTLNQNVTYPVLKAGDYIW